MAQCAAVSEARISDDIIERCRRGDREAFRVLFETYKDRVYSIALFFFNGDEASAKFLTAAKAGNPPDLMQAEYQHLPSFVAAEAVAGEVPDDKQEDQDEGNDPGHLHPAWRRRDRVQHLTLLGLLTPPVRGHAPRLVHRQRHVHEQRQQRGTRVAHELDLQSADVSTGCCRFSGDASEDANWPRVEQ